jgi:hypothetical protein
MGRTLEVESGDMHELRATVQGLVAYIENAEEKRIKTDAAREQAEEAKALMWSKAVKFGVPLVLAILGGSGYGVKLMADQPQEALKRNADEVKTIVAQDQQRREHRLSTVESKVERLGEAHVETELRQYQQIEWIAEKIDKVHPKQADAVEKPPELRAYERDMAEKKKKAAVKDLWEE